MMLKIYSIYDAKSMAYETPICFRAKGEALRWFTELSNDPDKICRKFPEDFTLFELGDYDNEKGILHPYKDSVPLGKAIEFLKGDKDVPQRNGPHL